MASIGSVDYSTLGGLSEQSAIAELKAEVQAVKAQTTSILQGVDTLKDDVAIIKTNTTPETP